MAITKKITPPFNYWQNFEGFSQDAIPDPPYDLDIAAYGDFRVYRGRNQRVKEPAASTLNFDRGGANRLQRNKEIGDLRSSHFRDEDDRLWRGAFVGQSYYQAGRASHRRHAEDDRILQGRQPQVSSWDRPVSRHKSSWDPPMRSECRQHLTTARYSVPQQQLSSVGERFLARHPDDWEQVARVHRQPTSPHRRIRFQSDTGQVSRRSRQPTCWDSPLRRQQFSSSSGMDFDYKASEYLNIDANRKQYIHYGDEPNCERRDGLNGRQDNYCEKKSSGPRFQNATHRGSRLNSQTTRYASEKKQTMLLAETRGRLDDKRSSSHRYVGLPEDRQGDWPHDSYAELGRSKMVDSSMVEAYDRRPRDRLVRDAMYEERRIKDCVKTNSAFVSPETMICTDGDIALTKETRKEFEVQVIEEATTDDQTGVHFMASLTGLSEKENDEADKGVVFFDEREEESKDVDVDVDVKVSCGDVTEKKGEDLFTCSKKSPNETGGGNGG